MKVYFLDCIVFFLFFWSCFCNEEGICVQFRSLHECNLVLAAGKIRQKTKMNIFLKSSIDPIIICFAFQKRGVEDFGSI